MNTPQGEYATVMIITPDYAQQLLNNNTHNRPLSKRKVDEWTRLLKNNQWIYNGDAIRVDTKGTLLDGQHRLHACVKSGIPFKAILATGIDPQAFHTIDTGKRRSASDALAIAGEKHTARLAATLSLLYKYQIRAFDTVSNERRGSIMNNEDYLNLLDNNPQIRESVKLVGNSYRPYDLAVFACFHYLASKVNFDVANQFYEKLHTGIGLELDCPILALRETLSKKYMSVEKPTTRTILALTIKAFNCYIIGKKVKHLNYRLSVENPEPFPKMRNLDLELIAA